MLWHCRHFRTFVAGTAHPIMSRKEYILTKDTAHKKLARMALEVAERNYREPEILLVGIKENGIVIAQKIASLLADYYSGTVTVLTLAMDKSKPVDIAISPATNFTGKNVLLVDDVANSGRTMLYAIKPLLNDHPKKIQTLALVERTHKTFPIAVDYTGLSVSTTQEQHIYVEIEEDEIMGAWMATTA